MEKDRGEVVLARTSNWPEPYKFIHFPSPDKVGLSINVDREELVLRCKRPVKGIVLEALGEQEVFWSDNAIDLFPFEERHVQAHGLRDLNVSVRHLGDGQDGASSGLVKFTK